MELSQEEKDRIVAEEKLRFETKTQLMGEKWGKHHGWGGPDWMGHGCHRGGFWKGLLLGLFLALLFGFLFHHHRYGHGGWRHGGYGGGGWNQGWHDGHGWQGHGSQDPNQDSNPGK